jgi:Ca2+-binding EF-hand superfamily protein
MFKREDFEAAWKRWDSDNSGTLELSEVRTHATEIANLIGDPGLEDADVLYEFALSFYDGLANPSEGLNNKLDKEEVWQLLQEATSHS